MSWGCVCGRKSLVVALIISFVVAFKFYTSPVGILTLDRLTLDKQSRAVNAAAVSHEPNVIKRLNGSTNGGTNGKYGFLLAVFRCEKTTWFQRLLHRKGVPCICIPAAVGIGHDKQCNRGHFPWQPCEVDQVFLRAVFSRSNASIVYLDRSVSWAWASAAYMSPRPALIRGSDSKSVQCNRGRYDQKSDLKTMARFSMILTDSARHSYVCHSHSFSKRMLDLAEYYGLPPPTRAALANKRTDMKAKWSSGWKPAYFVSSGNSGRDFATVIEANAGSGLHLKIFHGGQPVQDCTPRTNCEVMPFVSRSEYSKVYRNAKFIAVPLGESGTNNAKGDTSMIEAMHEGKVLVWTDLGVHLADDFTVEGKTGYKVGTHDVAAWKKIIHTLSHATASTMQDLESSALDVADNFSQEGVVERFLSQVNAIQTKLANESRFHDTASTAPYL